MAVFAISRIHRLANKCSRGGKTTTIATIGENMKKLRGFVLASLTVALTGCVSGTAQYSAPSAYRTNQNSVVVAHARDVAWQAAVPRLSKEFFVINTIDKSSGIVNISYSGDPSKYVDCGRIRTQVSDIHGERVYDFAAASASEQYEGTGWVGAFHSPRIAQVDRRMSLEGRMNIVFEDVDATHTRITVSTRYLVTRDVTQRIVPEGFSGRLHDTISFNTGGSATFAQPANVTSNPTTCSANGQFEENILDLVKS